MFRQKWSKYKEPERGVSCRKKASMTEVQGAPRRKISDGVEEEREAS